MEEDRLESALDKSWDVMRWCCRGPLRTLQEVAQEESKLRIRNLRGTDAYRILLSATCKHQSKLARAVIWGHRVYSDTVADPCWRHLYQKCCTEPYESTSQSAQAKRLGPKAVSLTQEKEGGSPFHIDAGQEAQMRSCRLPLYSCSPRSHDLGSLPTSLVGSCAGDPATADTHCLLSILEHVAVHPVGSSGLLTKRN